MLAANYTGKENLLKYTASYKLDGIRCLVNGEEAITRTGKPIRNKQLHDILVSNARRMLCSIFQR